jgi:hypothetical protein
LLVIYKTHLQTAQASGRKVCGHEPEGARLTIKSQPHDLGRYLECAVVFQGNNQAAATYAAKGDEHAPVTWEVADMLAPISKKMRRG